MCDFVMTKKHQILLTFSVVNILCLFNFAYAQLTVNLEPEIDTQIIRIGTTVQYSYSEKLLITARANKQTVKYQWTVDGIPLSENPEKQEFLFIPPENIHDEVIQKTVSITVIDDSELTATDSLTFIIIPLSPEERRKRFKLMREELPVDAKIEHFQNRFIGHKKHYEELREREKNKRESINDEIVPVLLEIIDELKEIERIYLKYPKLFQGRIKPPDQFIRKNFEQEIISRLTPDVLPTVELILKPDTKVIYLGEESQILITAQPNKEGLQVEWTKIGPGTFKTKSFAGIYYSPDGIKGTSDKVTISITVTDDKGRIATDTVIFDILASLPMATPTPVLFPVRIHRITMTNSRGQIIHSLDSTYHLKPNEKININIESEETDSVDVKFICQAIRGIIENNKQYIAPDIPGGRDIITIKAIDKRTGNMLIQNVIKVKIIQLQ